MNSAERNLQLKVMVSDQERAALTAVADEDGVSVSDVIRNLVRSEVFHRAHIATLAAAPGEDSTAAVPSPKASVPRARVISPTVVQNPEGVVADIDAPLGKFFDPDDPLTPGLVRLAIIRDDLDYEIKNLGLEPDDDTEEVWRCNYFIRRLSVTFLEAHNVFEQGLAAIAKRQAHRLPPGIAPLLLETNRILSNARSLKTVRDALGAHVRPENAKKDKADPQPEPIVLRNHSSTRAHVHLNFRDRQRTSFRGLTSLSTFFLWPEATTLKAVLKKHDQLQRELFACIEKLLGVLDVLLATYWASRGLLAAPEGYDLGLVVPRRRKRGRARKAGG